MLYCYKDPIDLHYKHQNFISLWPYKYQHELHIFSQLFFSIFFTCNKLYDQIKSNHFYCHITTAQVPWWVKFLWACSRQCRKTTDNLPMDRQCKKKQQTIYLWTDSAKKTNKQFTYGQTVQKKQQTIYIWTVHIYRLYRRQCAKYTYIYSVHIVYYKDILKYQRHIIHRMGTSTLCTVSIHNVVYT